MRHNGQDTLNKVSYSDFPFQVSEYKRLLMIYMITVKHLMSTIPKFRGLMTYWWRLILVVMNTMSSENKQKVKFVTFFLLFNYTTQCGTY